jgi:hypothetical protein
MFHAGGTAHLQTERGIVSKYLVTYHGGSGMPDSPEARKQVMEAFQAWAATVGSAMVDPGAPLVAIKTVTPNGVTDAPASDPIGGYTLLDAGSLDAALGLVKSHPFVARGGSLQVSEVANLGG